MTDQGPFLMSYSTSEVRAEFEHISTADCNWTRLGWILKFLTRYVREKRKKREKN